MIPVVHQPREREMAVTLKRQKDNLTWRPFWYGVYNVDGKRKVVNLGLKWHGSPPGSGSLRDLGDAAFEHSREKAEAELVRYRDKAGRKGRATHLVERLIEEKTGQRVEYVTLDEILDRWLKDGRDRPVSKGYQVVCKAVCSRFLSFMRERNPKARFLYEVTPADVTAFAVSVQEKFSPKTYRDHLALLRPAFDRLLPAGASNPFRTALPRRSRNAASEYGESIHRIPFRADELQKLLETARDDAFMYPLIVTAMCTGMRRGDVCKLRWSAVDLSAGMLDVKTAKTGTGVEIPIFAPLRAVLESCKDKASEYVFPEAERMLRENPDGLTWRFKKIVAKTFTPEAMECPEPIVSAADVQADAIAAIQSHVPTGARQARLLDTFTRYAAGTSIRNLEKATGRPRSTISVDLHGIERWLGKRFVNSAKKNRLRDSDAIAQVTRIARPNGCRSASIRDWHALRTSFVTLALSAGVPMELVRRVTGHATVEVVLKHYFRPGREEFKAALENALPMVLTGKRTSAPAQDIADELVDLAKKLQAGKATDADRSRLRELAAGV